jgi:CheY-like chemotaxis protein
MGIVVPRDRGVVLVVDDDADYRAIVRDILERDRYFVVEAPDGRDALEILRSGAAPAIRLILLDLAMPTMSGWQLVDVLRGDPALSSLPVLVTSGIPLHGDASGIGATIPSLRKPIDEEHLLSAVSAALARGSKVSSMAIPAHDPEGFRTRRRTAKNS